MKALKTPNVLLSIELDGGRELALPRDIQRDPVRNVLEHVDLVVVRRGEKVTVDIPVVVTGDAAPDTLVVLETASLSVEAEATHIPVSLEVSIAGLTPGTQVHASDVPLPSGVVLHADPEILVVNVTAAPTADQLEAELAEAEADLGIVHEPTDEEIAATEEAATEEAAAEGDGADGDTPAPAAAAAGDQG
jgi:large subunit ribosomal protein L25